MREVKDQERPRNYSKLGRDEKFKIGSKLILS